jgi:hypothetical protein
VVREDEFARSLGAAARARVLEQYLDDRHLTQNFELFCDLVAGQPQPLSETMASASAIHAEP